MSMSLLSGRISSILFLQKRTARNYKPGRFRPPANRPYFGIYHTEGEIVRADELLVCQKGMNYHPGANVRFENDRQMLFLKANCDGTVIITREKVDVNPENRYMKRAYENRGFKDIYKLTFNVVPRRMSNSFKLVEVV